LDCQFERDYYEKDILKGAEVMFGERYTLVIHCLHFSGILCNLMKYDIAIVNRYNGDISLCLSIGIFSLTRMVLFSSTQHALNRRYETCKILGRFRPGIIRAKRKRVTRKQLLIEVTRADSMQRRLAAKAYSTHDGHHQSS
jgi:hypothetical protein